MTIVSMPPSSAVSTASRISIFKWIILVQALLLLALGAYFLVRGKSADVEKSFAINEKAWQASYAERGLPIPPGGPREGYWAARLNEKIYDPVLVWRHAEQDIPSLVSIDANGFQYARAKGGEPLKLMILGGSVAFGAYASDEAHTYYARLRDMLAERGVPVDITVVAAGAWKSGQEVSALETYFERINPDAVLFFSGLNDLTLGATAYAKYGQQVRTSEGSEWSVHYHEHDYDARVRLFFENLEKIKAFSVDKDTQILFSLQPALFEKRKQSDVENEINDLYNKHLGPNDALRESYMAMGKGLAESFNGSGFLDLSRIFDGESATTFADMWHFSDPGHEIVAEAMADFLEPILAEELSAKQSATSR